MSKKVIMEAIVRLPEGSILKNEANVFMEFGGFAFEINGMSVPFDFEGFGANFCEDEKGRYLHFSTYNSGFFRQTDIDTDTYVEDYEKLGITAEEITAKFLVSATAINEFYFNVGMVNENGDDVCLGADYVLDDVYFIDELDEVHHVNKELLGKKMSEY